MGIGHDICTNPDITCANKRTRGLCACNSYGRMSSQLAVTIHLSKLFNQKDPIFLPLTTSIWYVDYIPGMTNYTQFLLLMLTDMCTTFPLLNVNATLSCRFTIPVCLLILFRKFHYLPSRPLNSGFRRRSQNFLSGSSEQPMADVLDKTSQIQNECVLESCCTIT